MIISYEEQGGSLLDIHGMSTKRKASNVLVKEGNNKLKNREFDNII